MRRADIEEQNRYLLERQREFRMAADVVAEAWMVFPEVELPTVDEDQAPGPSPAATRSRRSRMPGQPAPIPR
ncbi:MAG: hypothetical protein JWO83_227 [Caulobacteraceae bacterium]|jgi:hypothetical protein|nr:hypothetical protein [Caulobacteraceae bacterium]